MNQRKSSGSFIPNWAMLQIVVYMVVASKVANYTIKLYLGFVKYHTEESVDHDQF